MSNVQDVPIVMSRNQKTGDYQFPQTHVEGVIGLEEYIENNLKEDSGWIKYSVTAPMEKDTQFTSSDYNGFACGYRVINILGVEKVYIRFNLRNIKSGSVVKLPNDLLSHAQSFTLRTGTARLPVQVSIKADGTMTFYPNGSDSGWSSSDYIYQEVSFLNN